MATPLLIVTDAGLAIANQAGIEGPYIHITHFKIGSAYGYEPNRSDISLNGTILYESVPTSYQNVGDNTLDIICQLPPAAGPFEFGEIGLYVTDDNTGDQILFAKAVWDTPQTKTSSLGTNVNSQSTFHCLLKLQQSIAVFQVDVSQQVTVWEVDKWSDVVKPSISSQGGVPLVLVRELDDFDNSSLLTSDSPEEDRWTIGTNYHRVAVSRSITSTLSSVTIGTNYIWGEIPPWKYNPSLGSGYSNRRFVVEILGLNAPFRSVVNVAIVGSNLRLDFNADPLTEIIPNGTDIIIYENLSYPFTTLATRDNEGRVKAGNGIAVPQAGIFETYGLLHGVPNSGRELTNGDSLGNYNLPSGEYNINVGSLPPGLPAEANTGGRLRISNFQNHVCQEFFPWGGPNWNTWSYPWQRMYSRNLNQWMPWRKLGGIYNAERSWMSLGPNVPATYRGILVLTFNPFKEADLRVYVNGTMVANGYNRDSDRVMLSIPLEAGQVWSSTASAVHNQFKPFYYSEN